MTTEPAMIPNSVIEADHQLEIAIERTSEELARHRWHQTLDPDGPGYSMNAYAKAVGRARSTIQQYVNGYAEWVAGRSATDITGSSTTVALSFTDCLRKAAMSAEKREVAEIVAETESIPISTVANRVGAGSLPNTIEQAREKAERTGVTIGDAAREIAERNKRAREGAKKRETAAKSNSTLRYIEIEGKVARAKRLLTEALKVADQVDFAEDELEMLKDSLDNLRAVLNLLDLRMGGAADIDWDAELANLADGAS